MNLVEFLMIAFRCGTTSELRDILVAPDGMERVTKALGACRLRTTHLKRNFTVRLDRLFAPPCYAFRHKFLLVTVVQYVYCKHHKLVTYKNLPCVGTKGRNGHYWLYPMEFLEVVY